MTPSELREVDEKLCGMVEEKPAPNAIRLCENPSGEVWFEDEETGEWMPLPCTESLDACMKIYAELRKRLKIIVTLSHNTFQDGTDSWSADLEYEAPGQDGIFRINKTATLAFSMALLAAGEKEKG
jgi:hypothetical protein